jgi:hypothetical protein
VAARVHAPPLPSNAFAHLTPDAPPPVQTQAYVPNPAFAPQPLLQAPPAQVAGTAPASLYDALGFSNGPPQADPNPFASARAALHSPAPTLEKSRSSWAEWLLLAAAAVVSATLVLQRNGLTREWFGPNPQSSYAKLEASVFGEPSIDTVAGVKALLKELASKAEAGGPGKTTASHQRPSTVE